MAHLHGWAFRRLRLTKGDIMLIIMAVILIIVWTLAGNDNYPSGGA